MKLTKNQIKSLEIRGLDSYKRDRLVKLIFIICDGYDERQGTKHIIHFFGFDNLKIKKLLSAEVSNET